MACCSFPAVAINVSRWRPAITNPGLSLLPGAIDVTQRGVPLCRCHGDEVIGEVIGLGYAFSARPFSFSGGKS
jgi:hypothetical protein